MLTKLVKSLLKSELIKDNALPWTGQLSDNEQLRKMYVRLQFVQLYVNAAHKYGSIIYA